MTERDTANYSDTFATDEGAQTLADSADTFRSDDSAVDLSFGSASPVDHAARRAVRRTERAAQRRAQRLSKLTPAFIKKRPGDVGGERTVASQAFKVTLIVGASLLAIFVVGASVDLALNAGKVHRGVSLLNVDLGGATQAQAAEKIETALAASLDNQVVVSYDGSEWPVTGAQIGIVFNAEDMAAQAYAVGRSGGVATQLTQRVSALISGVAIDLESSFDEEASAPFFTAVSDQANVAPTDATVVLSSGKFTVKDGADGRGVKLDQMVRDLPLALVRGDERYEVPVGVVSMDITLAEAQAAADVAAKLTDESVTVTYESDKWKFSPAKISELFTFVRSDDATDGVVLATFDTPKTGVVLIPAVGTANVSEVVLKTVGTEVGTAPQDATFKTGNGTVSIVPSKSGVGADPAKLAADLVATLESEKSPKAVTIVTTTVEPAITTADAKAMGVVERISTYTTTFSSGNAPRVNNIKTLAAALDGTLIAPGATFSFNGTVGERTADKGYMEAGAIVNGELVNQLGGGICQVNTTLFNAVLLSGLPINERRNHSYYISHYPLGRDATVSWGGPDFKFTNDSDTWVLISTGATNGSVTISIYGTDPGYDVTLKTSGWLSVKAFKTKEIPDPTMAIGRRVVETAGVAGGRVSLTRTVTKDGTTVRSDTFPSSYTTVTEVVRVGTKPTTPVVNPSDPGQTTP